jgi:hypothetical protein
MEKGLFEVSDKVSFTVGLTDRLFLGFGESERGRSEFGQWLLDRPCLLPLFGFGEREHGLEEPLNVPPLFRRVDTDRRCFCPFSALENVRDWLNEIIFVGQGTAATGLKARPALRSSLPTTLFRIWRETRWSQRAFKCTSTLPSSRY